MASQEFCACIYFPASKTPFRFAKRTYWKSRTFRQTKELKSDGPLLINILSEEATIPQKGEKDLVEVFHEGVRNEAVARSIADLIVNYGGNHNLSLTVKNVPQFLGWKNTEKQFRGD